MANIFSAEGVGDVQSPFTAQAPVVDQSVNTLLDTASKGLGIVDAFSKAKSKAQSKSVLTSFTIEQLKFADAVDQGKMTSQQARRRMRNTFVQFAADNSSLIGELQETQSKLMSTAGLAQVADKGTQEEQFRISEYQKTQASGWAPIVGATNEQLERGTNARISFERSSEELKARQAGTTLQLSSSQLTDIVNRREQESALTQFAKNHNVKFATGMSDVLSKFSTSERTEESKEVARQAVQGQWLEVQSLLSQAPDARKGFLEARFMLLEQQRQITLDAIEGKVETESANAEVERLIALGSLDIMRNPRIAKLAVTDRLLRNLDIVNLMKSGNEDVVDWLVKASEGDMAVLGGDSETNRLALGNLRDYYRKSLDGDLSEQDVRHGEAMMGTFVESISDFRSLSSKPGAMKAALGHLADPTYGEMAEKNGSLITPEHTAAVKEIHSAHMSDKVQPYILDKYQSAVLPVFKAVQGNAFTIPNMGTALTGFEKTEALLDNFIIPHFDGSNFSFILNPDLALNESSAGGPVVGGIQTALNELNDKVSPAIQQSIFVEAHLGKNRKYQQAYDATFQTMFGISQEQSKEQSVGLGGE